MNYIFVFLFMSITLLSQVEELILPATSGDKVLSQVTEPGDEYLIIVEGEYSMWPQYNENTNGCVGADAAYIYDVPREEMDAFRWPPDSIEIPLVGKVPFVPLPKWVGDEQEYSLPPQELGTPLILMSFRKNTGFRINGEPLPNSGLNDLTHRYQITKIGTGEPFEFEILDSAYNVIQESTISRYEDNCGELKVYIQKIEEEGINICDIKPICDGSSYVGLNLDASVYVKDTNSIEGRRNLLTDLDYNQIAIVDNGRFICDIDSIVCGSDQESISVGIVIDRSGSMLAPISEEDQTVRIEASKNSINNFIDNLRDIDSAFVMSFAETVTEDQNWTNDKNALKGSISGIMPAGRTQFYQAVIDGVDKVKLASSPNRFLVVLSDGANTIEPDWDDQYVEYVGDINIPIYFIALGFSQDPADIEALDRMSSLADACGGKVFDVRNSEDLDNVYEQIIVEEKDSDCCSIYFPIDGCEEGELKTIRLLFAPEGTNLISEYITFECAECEDITSSIEIEETVVEDQIVIFPNPARSSITIQTDIQSYMDLSISLYDINGKFINVLYDDVANKGFFNQTLELGENKSYGMHILQIKLNNKVINKKIILE